MANLSEPRDEDRMSRPVKQRKKGFQVGPANLPDGTHKRKVQKIKKDLIRKAQIRKTYAKVRKTELGEDGKDDEKPRAKVTHPARQAMIESPEAEQAESSETPGPYRREKRPKADPFKTQLDRAQKKKEQQEEKRKAIDKANEERQRRREDNENFRRKLDRARRPDKKGQRRLGRESKLLPGMVEHLFRKLEQQKAKG